MKMSLIAIYRMLLRLDNIIEKIVVAMLIFTVTALLAMSVIAIIFRWFNSPLLFADPLIRHLVFYTAFLGGIVATGRNSHICIDIISRYLKTLNKEKLQIRFDRAVFFLSFIISIWMGVASLDFLQMELEYGRELFFGISTGQLVAIIPIGFFVIGYRFFIHFISSITLFKESEQ